MPENINIEREQHNITISEPMRDYHLPIASKTVLGGIKVGDNLTIEEDGTLNAESTEYILPTASASTLGGVKVGNNLAINNGILTAAVDSVLSGISTNPVQNSVITSNISSINSDLGQLDTRVDNLESGISTLSSTVTSQGSAITTLNTNVSALQTTVETNTTNIDTNTGNITANVQAISDLDDRLDTAEGAITDLGNSVDTMGGQINDVIRSTNTTVEYTSLMPVATWSTGELVLRRRGYLGFLFLNLEGNFLLGANSSTTIYTFQTATNIPTYETSASVLTDVGNIVLSVDDQGVVKLTNPSASALTISKVYGNVPLVY